MLLLLLLLLQTNLDDDVVYSRFDGSFDEPSNRHGAYMEHGT